MYSLVFGAAAAFFGAAAAAAFLGAAAAAAEAKRTPVGTAERIVNIGEKELLNQVRRDIVRVPCWTV